MRKQKKLLCAVLVGVSCLSSVSFGATKNLETIVPTQYQIMPRGGTGWTGGFGNARSKANVYVMGEKMPAAVEVYVKDGKFVFGQGETNWTLNVKEGRNSGIFFSTMGCTVKNTPSWDISQKGYKYSTLLQLKGDGSLTETSKVTLEAAIEIMRQGGISLSIPGVGEVSSEAQLKTAFKGAYEKQVSMTMSKNYNSYHEAVFTVEGYEDIDFKLK